MCVGGSEAVRMIVNVRWREYGGSEAAGNGGRYSGD